MLARSNRVVRGDDFRQVVRRGRRVGTSGAQLYIRRRSDDQPTRFGFIVSKAVGNSVHRNLITRRLRAIGREALVAVPSGSDVVIRALPGSPAVSWATLRTEILGELERSAGEQ